MAKAAKGNNKPAPKKKVTPKATGNGKLKVESEGQTLQGWERGESIACSKDESGQ